MPRDATPCSGILQILSGTSLRYPLPSDTSYDKKANYALERLRTRLKMIDKDVISDSILETGGVTEALEKRCVKGHKYFSGTRRKQSPI
mgnify:CR=1 FL=1